jgi:hypothetical protein
MLIHAPTFRGREDATENAGAVLRSDWRGYISREREREDGEPQAFQMQRTRAPFLDLTGEAASRSVWLFRRSLGFEALDLGDFLPLFVASTLRSVSTQKVHPSTNMAGLICGSKKGNENVWSGSEPTVSAFFSYAHWRRRLFQNLKTWRCLFGP